MNDTPLSRVFVSYSRRDRDFAVWLHQALEQSGVDVFRDLEDTLPGEQWWTRLKALITSSDTIVFVLSRHSAASTVCADELGEATNLGKRIIPIMIEPVDWNVVPADLASLHSIDFINPAVRGQALANLIAALAVDIDWVREHTRIGELAQHWVDHGRRTSALLRGPGIADAERWATSRPPESKMAIDRHVEFIAHSRQAQSRMSRIVVAVAVVIAVAAIALSVWAEINRREADNQRGQAVAERKEADLQRATAKVNERRAYAELAEAVRLQGVPTDALKLALASWPRSPAEGQMFEKSLNTLSDTMRLYRFPVGRADDVGGLIVSPDRSRAVYRELGPHIYGISAVNGTPDGASAKLSGQVDGGVYNRDGSLIAFWSFSEFAIADSDLSKVRFRISDEEFGFIDGFFAGNAFVGRGTSGGVAAWDAETGAQLWIKSFPYRQDLIEMSPDGMRIFIAGESKLEIFDTVSGSSLLATETDGVTFTGGRFAPDGSSLYMWDVDDHFYRVSLGAGGTLVPIYSVPVQSPEGRPTFSPDGKTFLVGDRDSIESRSLETGATVWGPVSMPWGLWRAEYSPDGAMLLVTHNDATFSYLDAATGTVLGGGNDLKGDTKAAGPLTAVVANDDGVLLFVNARNGQVAPGHMIAPARADQVEVLFGGKFVAAVSRTHLYVWPIAADNAAAAPVAVHTRPVLGARLLRDLSKVVSWSDDGSLRVSDVSRRVAPLSFGDPIGQITGVTIAPAEDWIVVSGQSGAVLYKIATGDTTVLSRGGSHGDPAVAFSPDGQKFVLVQEDGVQLWVRVSETFQRRGGVTHAGLFGTAITNADVLIGWNENVYVWKDEGTKPWIAPSRGRWITNAVPSMDGSKLLVCGIDGDVVIYSLDDYAVLAEQQIQAVVGCQWSPNETYIVAWATSTAFVLDSSSGKVLLEAPSNGRSDSLEGATFSENEEVLLTWSQRGVSMAWNLATGKSLAYRDTDWIASGSLNNSGTRALTTTNDGNMRVLDTKTMKQLGYTHTGTVGARFLAGKSGLLIWSTDGTVSIWPTDPSEKGWLIETACEKLGNTSLDDIEKYYGFGKIDPICTPSQISRVPDEAMIAVPRR